MQCAETTDVREAQDSSLNEELNRVRALLRESDVAQNALERVAQDRLEVIEQLKQVVEERSALIKELESHGRRALWRSDYQTGPA